MRTISFTAPPTVAAFSKSTAFTRLIAGPVGSGKTVGCIFELLRRCMEQERAPDGFRYTRWVIARQTLTQLRMTVLKDIQEWLSGLGEWKVSESTFHLRFGDVRSEWILLPLEEEKDQERLLSSQLTGVWFSECTEVKYALLAPASGRCGRYPSGPLGAPTWRGVICDTNMPVEGSDWWEAMEGSNPNMATFKQPGGLDEGAENLNWIDQTKETLALPIDHPLRLARGRAFYERLSGENNLDWVRRYIHALYGNDPTGTAIYRTTFKRQFHVVRDLEPIKGRLLVVGQDFGRNPWSLITQLDHRGRMLVLGECNGTDIGLEQHIRMNLRPELMSDRYLGCPIVIIGDPAGNARSSLYEENEFDLLKSEGFMAFPAPTNDPDTRIRAVEKFMLQHRGGEPAFVVDEERCPVFIHACDGGYRYGKLKTGVVKASPDKNKWSHVSDAGQYAALALGGSMYSMLFGKIMGAGRRRIASGNRGVGAKAWT